MRTDIILIITTNKNLGKHQSRFSICHQRIYRWTNNGLIPWHLPVSQSYMVISSDDSKLLIYTSGIRSLREFNATLHLSIEALENKTNTIPLVFYNYTTIKRI